MDWSLDFNFVFSKISEHISLFPISIQNIFAYSAHLKARQSKLHIWCKYHFLHPQLQRKQFTAKLKILRPAKSPKIKSLHPSPKLGSIYFGEEGMGLVFVFLEFFGKINCSLENKNVTVGELITRLR